MKIRGVKGEFKVNTEIEFTSHGRDKLDCPGREFLNRVQKRNDSEIGSDFSVLPDRQISDIMFGVGLKSDQILMGNLTVLIVKSKPLRI